MQHYKLCGLILVLIPMRIVHRMGAAVQGGGRSALGAGMDSVWEQENLKPMSRQGFGKMLVNGDESPASSACGVGHFTECGHQQWIKTIRLNGQHYLHD
jgi:hypothetical protein